MSDERRLGSESGQLERFVSASPLAIVVVDLDGLVLLWNPAAERLFGWREEEVLGRIPPNIPADDLPGFRETIERTLAGEERRQLEVVRVRRDGSPVQVSLSSALLRDAAGAPVGALGFLQDITVRKRREAEDARLAQALAQAAEAVIITDAKARIQYVNPAFERITGYTRAEVLGQNPRVLKSGQQDDAFYERMWKALSSGETWTARFINRRKDGSFYTQQSVISPVWEQGRIVNYVAVARDVTHEEELENQLRQAQKLEAVGQLTGGIAHDFNNLLSVVIASAEMLAIDLADAPGETRESVDEILGAGRQGAAMVRKLLSFGRQAELRPTAIALGPVIEDVASILRRTIPETIRIETVLDEGIDPAKADAGAIQQVLMNLANNARDAMPDGGVLTVRLTTAELDEAFVANRGWGLVGRYATICVGDTGTGISPDIRARVMEPFFTTKPAGKGTGLGLSMVYGLIKQHGGFLDIESALGAGTTVTLYLPFAAAAEADAEPKAAVPPARGEGAVIGGPETILLVEDERALRDAARRVLERLGYTVLLAADGEEALAVCLEQGHRIDLLISDLVMPRMGGGELARELKARGVAIPILFVSGYAGRDVRGSEGIHDYLQKPWDVTEFARRVRRALDARRPENGTLPPKPSDTIGRADRA